jgi:hypothetical protein
MALSDKSKKSSQKLDDNGADAPDQNNEVQAEASDENKDRNIVVVIQNSQFSKSMIEYTIEMAVRMNCGIIAVNAANINHDITEIFSNAHDVAFEEFKKNSTRDVERFRAKAADQGINFAHTVQFSCVDSAVAGAIEEYGEIQFVISENPTDTAKAKSGLRNFLTNRSTKNEKPTTQRFCVYAID